MSKSMSEASAERLSAGEGSSAESMGPSKRKKIGATVLVPSRLPGELQIALNETRLAAVGEAGIVWSAVFQATRGARKGAVRRNRLLDHRAPWGAR